MSKMLKAVALKYPEGADAPFICAKSKGKVAEQLLKIAEEHSVPVVENELLTDVLTVQEIGAAIPEETWEVVAKIFAFIIKNDQRL